jgi:hypothetical protein
LNFEYTYISLFGFKVFEPMAILTNSVITIYGIFAYLRTLSYHHKISRDWALFFLLMGVSCLLGSVSHGVHEQLGETFLRVSWFGMNALSLICIYFFYRAAFTYSNLMKGNDSQRLMNYLVVAWIAALLIITFFLNDFLLIKIHAGIVLAYSLIVHSITYRNKRAGSGYIVAGIIVAFLSIIVHSLKFSFGEWFNYKDISHVIMLTSLVLLYQGVKTKIGPSELLVGAD